MELFFYMIVFQILYMIKLYQDVNTIGMEMFGRQLSKLEQKKI